MCNTRFNLHTSAFASASRLAHHMADGTWLDLLVSFWTQYRLNRQWRKLEKSNEPQPITLENGLKLIVFPYDRLSEAIFKGTFEQNEQAFVRDLLRCGDTFVDVGANIGLFTISAASIVGEKGKVVAFEPTLITYTRLKRSVELNRLGNVLCIRAALSDRTESRLLVTSLDGHAAWNSLAQPTAGADFGSEEVECTTWDEFATLHQLEGSVTLMKIDIEGWELYALNGAENCLKSANAPSLLVEFTEANALAAGTSCTHVYSRLLGLGYKIYGFNAAKKMLWLDPPRKDYPYVNLLATKQIDWVAGRLGYSIVDAPCDRDH